MSEIFSLEPFLCHYVAFWNFLGNTGEISTWKFPHGFPRERRRKYPHKKFPFISPEFLRGNYEDISTGMIPWNSPINPHGNLGDVDGSPAGCQSIWPAHPLDQVVLGSIRSCRWQALRPQTVTWLWSQFPNYPMCAVDINDKKTILNIKTQETIPLKYFGFCCSSHLPVIQVCTKLPDRISQHSVHS